MPKLKTHKGARKRFKVSSRGKARHKRANRRHNLSSKTTKQKRHLREMPTVFSGDELKIRHMLPFLF